MITVYAARTADNTHEWPIGRIATVTLGYAVLPVTPAPDIPAGILADYLEEYAYVGIMPEVGSTPMEHQPKEIKGMREVLGILRDDPLLPCRCVVDALWTHDPK